MRITIQFNDKLFRWTVEIYNVTSNTLLTAEFVATEIVMPQNTP